MSDVTVDHDTLRRLADAPLADPLRLNLPLGRRAARRSGKPVYTDEIGVALTSQELRTRKAQQADAKHSQMLDYYAGTTVPFERIAIHCSMDVKHVAEAMKQRGRTA